LAETPPFPGAIGVTHLRVYATEAPDGLAGGTPHLHTLCTEAYSVVRGRGRVQTLTAAGFEEVPLEPGALVWFTPGTIHRLVNDGDLEIYVLMQNAGLPEAGDMVITLPADVVDDPGAYAAVATLPPDEATTTGTGSAARARRDAGVRGFTALREAAAAGDLGPLLRFHDAARRIVAPHLDRFEDVWRDGPARAAAETGDQLAALRAGSAAHLRTASVHRLPPPGGERRMGCCGTLGTYVP
jgi:mannose-6-phosphate isomerase-like protein (cupin superfamily)